MTIVAASTESVSRLLVAIVVYRPDMPMLERTLASIDTAFEAVKRTRPSAKLDVCVINNGGLPASFDTNPRGYRVLSGHGNVGYGRGHNLALDSASDYHLILNPDIELETNALVEALVRGAKVWVTVHFFLAPIRRSGVLMSCDPARHHFRAEACGA